MEKAVLEIKNLKKSFGGLTAIDNISFNIYENSVTAIVGPNGAGKTTLLSQIAGEIKSDSGYIKFFKKDITSLPPFNHANIGIARSFQITSLFPELNVLENTAMAVQAHNGHSFQFFKPAKADNDVIEAAITLLKKVGLSNRAYSPAGIISHGEHRQLEIAMALASKPKLLLLDEPMAGMGLEEAKKITKLLKNISKELTIILIEHDMDTVFTLANRLIVLVSGKVIADGPPEKIRKLDHVRKAYLGEEEDF